MKPCAEDEHYEPAPDVDSLQIEAGAPDPEVLTLLEQPVLADEGEAKEQICTLLKNELFRFWRSDAVSQYWMGKMLHRLREERKKEKQYKADLAEMDIPYATAHRRVQRYLAIREDLIGLPRKLHSATSGKWGEVEDVAEDLATMRALADAKVNESNAAILAAAQRIQAKSRAENEMKKKERAGARVEDGVFNISNVSDPNPNILREYEFNFWFLLTPKQWSEFQNAYTRVGILESTQIIYDAITNAAQPKKEPTSDGTLPSKSENVA